jgi:hypothetical protein
VEPLLLAVGLLLLLALNAFSVLAECEQVVITMDVPVGSGESTNLLKIHRIR